jgi:hypothetical protein
MTSPYFCTYLPFEENLALYEQFELPLPKVDLYQVFIEIGLLVLEILKNNLYFYTFGITSPWRRGLPFL